MVRRHRQRLGWTQEELARRSGLSVRSVRAIERGAVRPRESSLRRLTAVLGAPADDVLTVGVLGPLVVRRGGVELSVRAPMPRALLGLLALHSDRLVSQAEIVDVLWDSQPPASAAQQVRVHVARLRSLLGVERSVIVGGRGGYRLDGVAVDLGRFDELVSAARSSTDPGEALSVWAQAVGWWRGPVLADAPARLREHPSAVAANRRRVDAVAAFADAAFGLGRHDAMVRVLQEVAGVEPLNEGVHARLMLALAGAGEQAAALAVFAHVRDRLADELGVVPGAELRTAHLRVLRQEIGTVPGMVTPAQLPLDVYGFTGRVHELAVLDGLLSRSDQQPTAVVISAVWGTAGVGKTALAVHWAHRVADRFPDGQLYVNLRGFDPTGTVMTPAEAVRRFLDALEVPVGRIPTSLDAQIDLYRSLLSGRRMLVVLDNARDAEQVRPLLPGAPGCLALVTSRTELTGLVAAEGAHPLALDVLSPDEAHRMLGRRLGANRVAAKPDAVSAIITRCAHLPLALAVVAARATTRPLDELAEELRTSHGLKPFDSDDQATDVRHVFSWSYRALRAPAARLFRLLGLHPGPDISIPAAASLTALAPDAVASLLAELTRAHLLIEHVPGRYAFHDLLRAYANELVDRLDSDDDRRTATQRMLDHYVHTGHAAAHLIEPNRKPIVLDTRRPGVLVERLSNYTQAAEWFTAEHPVLLSAIRQAPDAYTLQLTWTLANFLERRGLWQEYAHTQLAALGAAQRFGDRAEQARVHRYLAHASNRLGRFDEAESYLHTAGDLSLRAGDPAGQASAEHSLSEVAERKGQLGKALHHARRALELYRSAGHRTGEANALNAVGWYHTLLGEHEQAIAACANSLTIQQELDNRHGEGASWHSIGHANHQLGNYVEAVRCYEKSLSLMRAIGHRYFEAQVLESLGDTHLADNNPSDTRAAWRNALAILEDLDHADSDRVRTKLGTLVSPLVAD